MKSSIYKPWTFDKGLIDFPVGFGWRFGFRFNKWPYSKCISAYIGFYRRQKGGFLLRFPPDWKIWNIDMDRKK
jgi:hypothetical protein